MISKKDGQKESNLEKNNCCNSKKCCKNRGVKKVFSRILWALVFLVFAAFFTALVFIPSHELAKFGLAVNNSGTVWSMIGAISLASIAVISLMSLQWFNVFYCSAGSFLLANGFVFHWLNLTSAQVWGIFGITTLLAIAFSTLSKRKNVCKGGCLDKKKKYCGVEDFDEEISSNENVDISVKMSGIIHYVESENLKTVSISANCAGAKVYFQNAILADKKMVVDVDVFLSGVELYFPRDWKVVNEVGTILGETSINGRSDIDSDSPTILLKGKVLLGGVKVVYI